MILPAWLASESIIMQAVLSFYAIISAIFLHELGHVWVLKMKYDDVPIRVEGMTLLVGDSYQYTRLSIHERISVYGGGVLTGFLALLPMLAVVSWVFSLVIIIGYVFGCRHDLRNIWLKK